MNLSTGSNTSAASASSSACFSTNLSERVMRVELSRVEQRSVRLPRAVWRRGRTRCTLARRRCRAARASSARSCSWRTAGPTGGSRSAAHTCAQARVTHDLESRLRLRFTYVTTSELMERVTPNARDRSLTIYNSEGRKAT